MTPATKPVTRLTDCYERERGALRPIVATLSAGGVLLRLKGCRHTLLLPYSTAWTRAAWLEAGQVKAERDAAKKAKREAARKR